MGKKFLRRNHLSSSFRTLSANSSIKKGFVKHVYTNVYIVFKKIDI